MKEKVNSVMYKLAVRCFAFGFFTGVLPLAVIGTIVLKDIALLIIAVLALILAYKTLIELHKDYIRT